MKERLCDGSHEEILEVLLPEGGELVRRAARVAGFARALNLQVEPASPVDPARVRDELDRQGAVRAGGAIEDLLIHHLDAHLGGESFAWFGKPHGGVQHAWRTLEEFRDEMPELPGVPAPDESSFSVAGRLLEGLYRLEWEEPRLELWRARLAHAGSGAEEGERAFRERLAAVGEGGWSARMHGALLAGLIESQLDRGGVREARLVLEDHSSLVAGDRRLHQLETWVRLLVGDLAGALRRSAEQAPWDGRLCDALIELRGRRSEALPALAGHPTRRRAGRQASSEDPLAWRTRRTFGASALCAFAFGPGQSVEPLLLDVAPALRSRVERWLAEREGACRVPAQPEHRLVIEAQPVFAHGAKPGGAIGAGALALAHVPVLDGEGEVGGWLHVECEHHLLPSRARLEELAAAWRLPMLRRARRAEPVELRIVDRVNEERPAIACWGSVDAATRLANELGEPSRTMCGDVFRELVETLGFKAGQRGWWGFVVREGEVSLTASGGEGLLDANLAPGGARAIDRCLATRGAVCFDEPEPRLALHRETSSGVVLPIAVRGELVGLFALESRRRRDFRPADVERYLALAQGFALPLSVAGFRVWHRERFGFDLWFDTSAEDFRAFAEQIEAVGRSSSPVVLTGPAGTGKMILARWIHWLGGGRDRPLEILGCGADAAAAERSSSLSERLRNPRGGSLVLDEVRALPGSLQEELLRDLEGFDREDGSAAREGKRDVRLVATSSEALARCVERGELRADLAARLDRVQVFVPPLVDRRAEIPGLVRFLAERFAREEGSRPPLFSDAALALFWRQAWPGNLRELESLVFKLVLLFPGEELEPEHVLEVARRFQYPLLKKLPSKRPRRADLVAALRTTFKAGTRFNKRRAALYLGWDPDTLVARLEDAGLTEENLAGEPSAWGM